MSQRVNSASRPECTYCHGSGILSVSKDPDEVADCVCTDPVEPAPIFVEFVETVLEVELMPWQRQVMAGALTGDRLTVGRGRRG